MSQKTKPKRSTKKTKPKTRGMNKREFYRVLDQLGNGGLSALTNGRFF